MSTHIDIGDFISTSSGTYYESVWVDYDKLKDYMMWFQFGEFNADLLQSTFTCQLRMHYDYAFFHDFVILDRHRIWTNDRYPCFMPDSPPNLNIQRFQLRTWRNPLYRGGGDGTSIRIRFFYDEYDKPVTMTGL